MEPFFLITLSSFSILNIEDVDRRRYVEIAAATEKCFAIKLQVYIGFEEELELLRESTMWPNRISVGEGYEQICRGARGVLRLEDGPYTVVASQENMTDTLRFEVIKNMEPLFLDLKGD